ncbi:MAG: 5-deoxy-glucuronate isomerase, partial [Chloroflexota bacterium]
MNYFASIKSDPGENILPHNPCKLLDFKRLVLSPGQTYTASAGSREILAVILGGKATFEACGKRFEKVGGRPNVFSGKPHSVYLPAGVDYCITADSPVEIALASAPSDLVADPYLISPSQVANGAWGAANFKR